MEPIRCKCLCGAIVLEAQKAATAAGHCHCDNCRRAHGAAYWTWATFERDAIRVVQGELVRYQQVDPPSIRGFCGVCGSTLTWESDRLPDEIDLSLACIDEEIGVAPSDHLFADRAPSWNLSRDDLPRKGGVDGKQLLP